MLSHPLLHRSESPWVWFWIYRASVTVACPPDLQERQVVRTLEALVVDWPGVLVPLEPGRFQLDLPSDRRRPLLQMDDCLVRLERPAPDRLEVSVRALFVLPVLTLGGLCLLTAVILPDVAPRLPWPLLLPILFLYLLRYAFIVRNARQHLAFLLESYALQRPPPPLRAKPARRGRRSP